MFRLTLDSEKFASEKEELQKGNTYICGVDEVGRGPLAGPVVCCAVIMPLNDEDIVKGVDDSKKLTEKKREALAKEIKEKAIAYNIYQIESEEIDKINILNAVKKCMSMAVKGLKISPNITFIDGNDIGVELDTVHKYIIKGDSKSYSIGCASIVAKVYRDNLMKEYSKEYSEYGFEGHKGYGTKAHIEAIKRVGPCKIHRRTFIKNFWAE